MLAKFVKFPGVGVLPAKNRAGKFNHRNLHSKTDSKIRNFMSPGITARGNHSFDSPLTESPRKDNSPAILKDFFRRLVSH